MTLRELLEKLDDLNDNSTIYAETNPNWSDNSHTVVCLQSENGEVIDAPKDLSYFLEVDIAKDVIEVWTKWNCRKPSTAEKCTAVIYYAENDAYIECP
jgi:hypothetical protein